MSSFQINGSSPPGGDPPGRGYNFRLPPAAGLDGEGRPVGQVGRPSVELNYAFMPTADWDWFLTFIGQAAYVALTSLVVYDPYQGMWTTYSTNAVMHRPEYEAFDYGGVRGVKILFSELE